MTATILIADDDPIQRRLLEQMLRRFGYATELVDGGEAALARIAAGDLPRIDCLILDLVMPDLDGMGVLGKLRERRTQLPVIVQTSPNSVESAISAMRAGAFDFVVKPVGAERMQVSLKNALRLSAMEDELRRLPAQSINLTYLRDTASGSPDLERVLRLAERAGKSNMPVLIEGERGTGKELVARAVHAASERRGRSFITINCTHLPQGQSEAILFGQDRASERSTGKLLEAASGAVYLEEVGDLPLETQARLMRLLQDGEIDQPGKRPLKVDTRLICSTSLNMIDLVKQGRFREDLYYRLNVFPITVPPLRSRRSEIGDLCKRFIARFAAQEGRPLRGLTSEAEALLCRYDWPGNVRQLENAIFRAVVLAEGDELTVAEFPQIAARVDGFDVRIPPLPATSLAPAQREIVRVEVRDPHVLRQLDERGHVRKLADMEADIIRFALTYYRGQMSEAARKLGIGRSTLYRKMKELGLQEEADAASAGSDSAAA
jgi:DNA-binding NtrC family response regulator